MEPRLKIRLTVTGSHFDGTNKKLSYHRFNARRHAVGVNLVICCTTVRQSHLKRPETSE